MRKAKLCELARYFCLLNGNDMKNNIVICFLNAWMETIKRRRSHSVEEY